MGNSASDLHIDQIQVDTLAERWPPRHIVRRARIIVPAAAVVELVAVAGTMAGVPVHGTLQPGQIRVQVAVSIVKLAVAFRASAAGGRLVLDPVSGVPGWLIGRAAPLLRDMPGTDVAANGAITVDIGQMLPAGITVPGGVRSVAITPDVVEIIIGGQTVDSPLQPVRRNDEP